MQDGYKRKIDYIRISITDRCNLRCVYCMPEAGVEWISHEEILTYEEIVKLCKCFSSLGITKVKLTGGEPLVRKDVDKLILLLKQECGMENVTLTTNGIFLTEQLERLYKAGLDGVNISLDTLDKELFKNISRRDKLDEVIQGINYALTFPKLNVKINCVPTNYNSRDILKLVALAKDKKLNVRFIEMMPIGLGKEFHGIDEVELKNKIEGEFGKLVPCDEKLGNGPCRYYSLENFTGKIGFISAISHKFCEQCNRVRLTADGHLKTCLHYEGGINLKEVLRNGIGEDELLTLIKETIHKKPISHHFFEEVEEENLEQLNMSQIGG